MEPAAIALTFFIIALLFFIIFVFIFVIIMSKATPIKDMNDKVLEEEEFNRNK